VVFGATIRFHGLDWGLPWSFHIDERLFVVGKAILLERSVADGGVPNAGITSYGILPLWLLVAARQCLLPLVQRCVDAVHGDAFAGTVLLARWISAVWGIGAILLIRQWGLRWGRGTALTAAALAAGFPALVQASHFGTVEAPLVAFVVAGLWAAERLAERPSAARAVAGGVVLGLAASVKSPGVLLALPLMHAALSRREGAALRIAIGAGVAAAVALLLNPALLPWLGGGNPGAGAGEHTTLIGNLRRAYSPDFHDWTLPYARAIPGWWEATRILPYAVGILPALAAAAGTVLCVRRRKARDQRLLLMLVPLVVLLLAARVKTVRFLLPALPALAILAAEAARMFGERFERFRVSAPAALALSTMAAGLAFTAVYAGPDTRVAAARWLDRNVTGDEVIALEDPPGYGPPLGSPVPELRRPRHRVEMLWNRFYTGHERRTETERARHLSRILDRCDVLALSEGHRAEFTAAPELRPVEAAFYADLDAGRLPFRRVAVFESEPRLGPVILSDGGAEPLMRVFDHPRIEIWRKAAAPSDAAPGGAK
jgi:hypothetical protein